MAPPTATRIASFPVGSDCGLLCFSPDRGFAVLSAGTESTLLRVVNLSGEILAEDTLPGHALTARIAPDGRHVLALIDQGGGQLEQGIVIRALGPDQQLIQPGMRFDVPVQVADAMWLDSQTILTATAEKEGILALRCPAGESRQALAAVRIAPARTRITPARLTRAFCAKTRLVVLWETDTLQVELFVRSFEGQEPTATERPNVTNLIRNIVIDDSGYHIAFLDLSMAGWYPLNSRNTRYRERPTELGPAGAVAIGGNCLALLHNGTVSTFLLTSEEARRWGDPWEGGAGPGLQVAAGADGTYVAVQGEDAIGVYLLSDHDILEIYDDNEERRRAAAIRLGERKAESAVPHLTRLLSASETTEREVAVAALARIGNDDAVDALLSAAGREGAEGDLARSALIAVGADQLGESVRRCVTAHRRAKMRGAVTILQSRLDVPVTPELCGVLDDADPRNRSAAAAALAGRADPSSLPALLAAIGDPDEATASTAWQGVAAIVGLHPPDDVPAAALSATEPYVAAVLRTGQPERARKEQPAGARILELVATALANPQRPPEEALNALQGLGRRDQRAATALVVGLLVADLIRKGSGPGEERSFRRQAADAAAAIGAAEVEWRAWARLGDLCAEAGQWRRANSHYLAAERVIDQLWAQLLGDLGDRFFFADKAALYESSMICRIRLGHTAAALETLEKAKTRFLGDLIARRHASPRTGLEAVDEVFWRAAGQRRPLLLEIETAHRPRDDNWEIVNVLLDNPAPEDGDTPLPIGMAALLEPEGAPPRPPDGIMSSGEATYHRWMVETVRDLWAVAAALGTGAYAGADEDIARDALVMLDDALGELRAARNGDPAVSEEILGRYNNAADTLYELAAHRRYGWALHEYDDTYVRRYAEGNQEYATFIDALQEAASYAFGRVPVMATFGIDEAARAAWWESDQYPVPTFIAQAAAAGDSTGAKPSSSATTALETVTDKRWEYITRVARGETEGLREAARLLLPEPGTALLEFGVTSHGTLTYVVISDANLDAIPLPPLEGWSAPFVFAAPAVTTEKLKARLDGPDGWKAKYDLREIDDGASWREKTDDTLAWLHKELFRPLKPWLDARGVRRLLIVPHRGLHLLPVTAWWEKRGWRRRYIIDDYEICFAPSLTLLQICQERHVEARPEGGRPIALLDPTQDLTLARLDALSLGTRLTPDRVFAGPDATAAQWRSAGADADPCHYAGHSEYNWQDPLESRIFLAEDPLTLGAMFDDEMPLRPGAEVTLSGCETTMTDPRDPADEYLGLASGFLFAGAASVLSTLWAVEDAPAMLIIARYYQERQRGAQPAAALRSAQRWLRHATGADFRHVLDERIASLDRLGQLTEPLRENLLSARKSVHAYQRGLFSHPVDWAAYTMTGGFGLTEPA